jgi:pimeloyl-ACP methyl ester carboxylesterase
MTVQVTHSGEIEIAYEILGPDGGAPLMLICGNDTQMIHWPDPFCAGLTQRGFQVVRFDNRDTGRSSNCRERPAYTLGDMADDASRSWTPSAGLRRTWSASPWAG